jgi:hypothetical protein
VTGGLHVAGKWLDSVQKALALTELQAVQREFERNQCSKHSAGLI